MNYKSIIKSQKMRFKILDMLKWVPDSVMLKLQYKIKTGRKLNLKNPQRFTEKIQYYKINYRNEIMHKCVNKYTVREYIENKGLGNILNECYGVYDNINDIKFNELPDSFVIKSTNGGGGLNIIICKDKDEFNIEEAKATMTEWLNFKPSKSVSREWAYDTNKNQIIIEKYLSHDDTGLAGISDYKFFCYNGKVEYIVFDGDRYKKHRRNFYDRNWKYIDVESDCETFGDIIEKPIGLDEMKKVAEKLSQDFPFVRVDLYWVDNKIYFGELTFYPWSGYVQYDPDNFDFELGKKFNL